MSAGEAREKRMCSLLEQREWDGKRTKRTCFLGALAVPFTRSQLNYAQYRPRGLATYSQDAGLRSASAQGNSRKRRSREEGSGG